jgi:hypothetical protein
VALPGRNGAAALGWGRGASEEEDGERVGAAATGTLGAAPLPLGIAAKVASSSTAAAPLERRRDKPLAGGFGSA